LWFQIQYNTTSAKFIELSSRWQMYTTEQSQLQLLQTVQGSLNHVIYRKHRTSEL